MKRWILLLALLLSVPSFVYVANSTVSTTAPRNDYTGTGSVATYSYTFRIFAATDLRVTTQDTAGVETALSYPTNYSVTGVNKASGGTITLTAGNLASGHKLTIRFDRTPRQSTDLRNQGSFFAQTHEDKFDELTRYAQQNKDVLDRSIHLPETEAGTSIATTLPTAANRASKFFGWNSSGEPIAAAGTSSNLGPVSSFINTLLDDADAATARATLGVSATAAIDSDFRVTGSADTTKKLAFEVDGLTTGTTRTITPPDANLTLPAITTKGDLPAATAAGVLGRKGAGSNGTVLMARSADSTGLAYVAALNKYIHGFTYSVNGSDAANDIDFASGGAMDSTGAYWLTGSALTKQIDVAWSVGTNAGMLDTGAVGNNEYYLWVIGRSDTGVVDYLASLSSSAPTMPVSYDFKRLIGWVKRVAGTNVAFQTYEIHGGGLEFLWDSPTLDINLANTLTTTRRTDAVKVPTSFSTVAKLNVVLTDAGAGIRAWIYCPDHTDLAPSITVAPLANGTNITATGTGASQMSIRTSSTGTIAARATLATMDLYAVSTLGFEWARRN